MKVTPREYAQTIDIAEIDLDWPEQASGQAVAWRTPSNDGWMCGILRRPGLGPLAERFESWARTRVEMLLTIGPHQDGWNQRSDGGWQIQGRLTYAPALDDLS